MNWIEAYKLWQRGELTDITKHEVFEFFKTTPTDDQLAILNRMTVRERQMNGFVVIGVFILGIFLGFILTLSP